MIAMGSENRRGAKCQFARSLGCMGVQTPSPHRSIFGDLAPKEREKVCKG
jgi:hypothetical protein